MRRLLLLLIALSAACESATGPDTLYGKKSGDTSSGTPLLTPVDTPYIALMPGDTSFWAVKGKQLDVVLHFRSTVSGQTGDQVLEFQLATGSLLLRPDGTPIANGDSVLITISPDTAGKLSFTFQPSGLVFDSTAPAVLTLWCNHAAADLNGDGVVNSIDEQLWYEMAIGKRENPTDPWSKQNTTRSSDGYQMQTPLGGFTGFSVAS